MQYNIPDKLSDELQACAEAQGTSVDGLIVEILEEWVLKQQDHSDSGEGSRDTSEFTEGSALPDSPGKYPFTK